jgi:WXXGXW repeat (2 copies)
MTKLISTRLTLLLSALTLAGCYVSTEPVAPASQGEVVVTNPPPPPPLPPEVAPPPPAPGAVWVAGAHRWDGHGYVYEKGHYENPPRPNTRYQAGHWERRSNGKAWVNGHWG